MRNIVRRTRPRSMGDANIPGYNRALVAPTGFASDPYPFLNNTWQKLAYTKVRYNANVHPVMGTQIVPASGLGRLGSPRIYNPLRLVPRRANPRNPRMAPRMRGLGDDNTTGQFAPSGILYQSSQLQPYGVQDQDASPVYIDDAGNVYDQSGTVLTDLSHITTIDAMRNAGVLPPSLNAGPPNQVYSSSGAGGITVTTPPPPKPPQPQQSWFSKPSGMLGLSNAALVASAAGAAALFSSLRSAKRR